MSFRKATTLALRLGRARDLEGATCRVAMSSSAHRGGGFSYLVPAYQTAHLDLSAASSSTLDAVLLSGETAAAEAPRGTDPPPLDVVQAAEWKASVEGEGRSGNVSLHSAMQSNVPEPYAGRNRSPVHLNMPRGVAGRRQQPRRYLSGDRIHVGGPISPAER